MTGIEQTTTPLLPRQVSDVPEWSIESVGGFTMSHGVIAHDPNCPPGRHPTRDCRCKVFRTQREAAAYIVEQTQAEATS